MKILPQLCILFILFVTTTEVRANNTLTKNEKLYTTCKLWGFLKYYHPNVAKGKYNWDNELFSILKKVDKASTNKELNNIYQNWIESLGKVKKTKEPITDKSYFDKNFDLLWIQDTTLFAPSLCENLKDIEKYRYKGKPFYTNVYYESVGNVKIQNEPIYQDFDWQNKELRLLSLFRYWNYIEYFFPYKYQTSQNWDSVLKEMIHKFYEPNSEIEYHLAMLELVNKTDDGHAKFWTNKTAEYFGKMWIPIKFKLIDSVAVVTGYYNDSLASISNLKTGDIITKVENEKIEDIFKRKSKYINGSNDNWKKCNSYNAIFNGISDSVKLEIIRAQKVHTHYIQRCKPKDFERRTNVETKKWSVINNEIGYVNMGSVEVDDIAEIMDKLSKYNSIIFDLRYYPKNTAGYIMQYLQCESVPYVKFIRPDLSYPGRFFWVEPSYVSNDKEFNYSGDVVVLVNEKTMSFGEFSCMCFQAYDNTTVIGTQTAGADGNVSSVEFPGGFKTQFSGIGVFYPNGTETQRSGIKIDIEIKQAREGIATGKDEVLEEAIEYINKKK